MSANGQHLPCLVPKDSVHAPHSIGLCSFSVPLAGAAPRTSARAASHLSVPACCHSGGEQRERDDRHAILSAIGVGAGVDDDEVDDLVGE